jgi:hypothetical protein
MTAAIRSDYAARIDALPQFGRLSASRRLHAISIGVTLVGIEESYCTDGQPMGVVLRGGGVRFGDAKIASDASGIALAGSARDRYLTAVQLAQLLSNETLLAFPTEPIYNMTYFAEALNIHFLPGITMPARMVILLHKREEPLRLLEIWFSQKLPLSAIDGGWFSSNYQIRYDDPIGYRSAVIDVLKLRGAFHTFMQEWDSKPDDEIVNG